MNFDLGCSIDNDNTRVRLFRRHENPANDKGIAMYISREQSYLSLFKMVESRLGISELVQLLTVDGNEVDDVALLNNNDILFAISKQDALRDKIESSKWNSTSFPSGDFSDSDSIPSMTTARIGSYSLGPFIGSGSFGKVHVGYQVITGDMVALKFIHKTELGNVTDAENIFTEIQCLNSLDHPNVIKLIQVINNIEDIVMAMEYASGGDLKDFVETYGPLSEANTSKIFIQILDAVSYCHRHHIVHYDLKLENILLDFDREHLPPMVEEGTKLNVYDMTAFPKFRQNVLPANFMDAVKIKIADFGLSKICNPGSTISYGGGSLAFIAPEVFTGEETSGPPRDVWSMGIVLYGMLFGKLPFLGATKNELIAAIRACHLDFPKIIPLSDEIRYILAGILNVDVEKRLSLSDIRSLKCWRMDMPHSDSTCDYKIVRMAHRASNGPIVRRRHLGGRESKSESCLPKVTLFRERNQTTILQRVESPVIRNRKEILPIAGRTSSSHQSERKGVLPHINGGESPTHKK